MMKSLVVGILALMPASALAQDLSVPLSWRKPNNTRSLSERISIGQNAIDTMLSQLNHTIGEFNGISFWQTANVWTAMANQDRYAGTAVNQAQVVNNLNLVFNLRPNYDEFQWWAQAAIAGYRAYHDENLLSLAIASWNHVTNFVITPSEAASGSVPSKNFTMSGQCEGQTMAGGVFSRPTIDDSVVNSVTTGLYVATSALLAEITGDPKYTDAAILSAQWIQQLNINNDSIVLEAVDAKDCSRSPASFLFTHNSGKYIEGLSILADVTNDPQWRSLMVTIVVAAVKNALWEGSDGIVTEGASLTSNNDGVGYKAIFIRGLAEAFERNPSNIALQTLLRSYIDVQYNAVLDLAANGISYSSDWHGPPQPFTTWGQLAALDVLTSAIIANT